VEQENATSSLTSSHKEADETAERKSEYGRTTEGYKLNVVKKNIKLGENYKNGDRKHTG
jgi:hypothetical protein